MGFSYRCARPIYVGTRSCLGATLDGRQIFAFLAALLELSQCKAVCPSHHYVVIDQRCTSRAHQVNGNYSSFPRLSSDIASGGLPRFAFLIYVSLSHRDESIPWIQPKTCKV